MGTDLASVNCAEDEKFLDSMMKDRGWYYIGLTDVGDEGNFRWSDGSKGTFTNWGRVEPNNSGGIEHCTAARADDAWNDIPCSGNYYSYFVCEI